MKEQIVITDQTANMRVDVVVADQIKSLSRSHIQRLLATQAITINSAPVKPNRKTKVGDIIQVDVPPARRLESAQPEYIALDIVYEDAHLIVINKPKGMVVHPAPGAESGTLVNALLAHCKDLSGIGGVLRPGIVHRLDKDTSGLLVAAKTDKAHKSLADQIARRTATRKYKALLWGNVPFNDAVIDAPIMRHPVDRKRMAVCEDPSLFGHHHDHDDRSGVGGRDFPYSSEDIDTVGQDLSAAVSRAFGQDFVLTGARLAVTEVKLLERFKLFSWVEAILQTGRTHQIRVHCAYAGYPVVGDTVYGGIRKVSSEMLRGQTLQTLNKLILGLHGQALHAYSLSFDHPETGRRMEFTQSLPTEINDLIEYLRFINNPDSDSAKS